ncbi:MAG TPA: hypothetical protein VGN44_14750 [Candidatus Angelobacter sp.]|jgi:ribosomal protein S5
MATKKKAAPAKKKVSHIKTKEAEVSIQFRGKAMEIKILLRPALAEQLTYRLTSPKRHPDVRK